MTWKRRRPTSVSADRNRERAFDDYEDGRIDSDGLGARLASAEHDAAEARRRRRPRVAAIVEAQRDLLARLPRVQADEAHRTCWACGYVGHVERAHLVAFCRGGGGEPTNFVLLCSLCHLSQPEFAPVDEQIEWLLEPRWP